MNYDVGVDFRVKAIQSTFQGNQIDLKLQIWDIATGGDRFRPLAPIIFRGASAALFLFDTTNHNSLDVASRLILEMRDYEENKNIQILLVGTKIDLID